MARHDDERRYRGARGSDADRAYKSRYDYGRTESEGYGRRGRSAWEEQQYGDFPDSPERDERWDARWNREEMGRRGGYGTDEYRGRHERGRGGPAMTGNDPRGGERRYTRGYERDFRDPDEGRYPRYPEERYPSERGFGRWQMDEAYRASDDPRDWRGSWPEERWPYEQREPERRLRGGYREAPGNWRRRGRFQGFYD